MSEFTEEKRTRMNLLYRQLRKATQGGFVHDGLIFWGVPPHVVAAYVAARVAHQDLATACISAHAGKDHLVRFAPFPDWIGWRIGRAWAAKLSEIEAGLALPQEVAA